MPRLSRHFAVLAAFALAFASTVAIAHDEDEADHEHHHHHGVVIQPRNFDHAVDLVRDGLRTIGEAVARGDLHALHELSDGVAVPARAFGKLAAARPGAAASNIRAINTLGQDLAKLVDAMHVAADSSKADVMMAKWKEIVLMLPQLDAISPRPTVRLAWNVGPAADLPSEPFVTFTDAAGQPLTDVGTVDGAPVRLVVVSPDFRTFAHLAPKPETANAIHGTWKFDETPLEAGEYAVFIVSRPGGRMEPLVQRQSMSIAGDPARKLEAVVVDAEPSKRIGGYLVRLKGHDHVHAGQPSLLEYMIDDAAQPGGIEMEALSGVPALFTAISGDTKQLIRASSVELAGTGEVRVSVTFPHDGLYATWLEFKHAGKITTVPFVIEVHGDH